VWAAEAALTLQFWEFFPSNLEESMCTYRVSISYQRIMGMNRLYGLT
jgi:hypothetical protein